MKRAAIIINGCNSNKIMFWVLGKPYEIGKTAIKIGGEVYELSIFEAPDPKENKHKLKQIRIIEKFCGENNIQSIFYTHDIDEMLESLWYAVKLLCVLREIEIINKEAIFNKSFGIVSDMPNLILLDAISEEASSIMILNEGLNRIDMEQIYKKLMNDKGLSIAYVDDVKFLIKQSRIVLLERSSPVTPHISLKRVLISPKQIDTMQMNDLHRIYEQEIGKAVIKLAFGMNILEMVSLFPFVYFMDTQGNLMKEEQVRLSLARNNKILTIQKC